MKPALGPNRIRMAGAILSAACLFACLSGCDSNEDENPEPKPKTLAEANVALLGTWKIDSDVWGAIPECTTTVVIEASGRFNFLHAPGRKAPDGTYPFGFCASDFGGRFSVDSSLSGAQEPMFTFRTETDSSFRCSTFPHVTYTCSTVAPGDSVPFELIFGDDNHIQLYSHDGLNTVFISNGYKRVIEP